MVDTFDSDSPQRRNADTVSLTHAVLRDFDIHSGMGWVFFADYTEKYTDRRPHKLY